MARQGCARRWGANAAVIALVSDLPGLPKSNLATVREHGGRTRTATTNGLAAAGLTPGLKLGT